MSISVPTNTATQGFTFTFTAALNGAINCPCGNLSIYVWGTGATSYPLTQIDDIGPTSNGQQLTAHWSPPAPGTYQVWGEFHPTGNNNTSQSVLANVTVLAPLSVLPTSVNLQQGVLVNTNFTAGDGNDTCTLTAGTIPAGLTLTNCALTGSPTNTGPYDFTVQVQDGTGALGSREYAGTATVPLVISPASLGVLRQGIPYTQTFRITGGASPYACNITGLPSGLTAGGSDGCTVSGTPTVGGAVSYSFTVNATDSGPDTGFRAYSGGIAEPIPTLGEWAVIGLASILAWVGSIVLLRRRRPTPAAS